MIDVLCTLAQMMVMMINYVMGVSRHKINKFSIITNKAILYIIIIIIIDNIGDLSSSIIASAMIWDSLHSIYATCCFCTKSYKKCYIIRLADLYGIDKPTIKMIIRHSHYVFPESLLEVQFERYKQGYINYYEYKKQRDNIINDTLFKNKHTNHIMYEITPEDFIMQNSTRVSDGNSGTKESSSIYPQASI